MREKTPEKPLTVYGTLRPFELTSHTGKRFGLEHMKNRVWVANFMFSHCPNECPAMNFKIGLLQESLGKEAGFLSFSVDPEKDTPAVLQDYAKRFNAKEDVWFFLTGPKTVISRILEDCHFADAEDPLLHGLRLVLLDDKGQVRGYHDYSDPFLIKNLTHAMQLLKEKG